MIISTTMTPGERREMFADLDTRRTQAGIRRLHWARLADVSLSAINKYLSGSLVASPETLARLSNAIGKVAGVTPEPEPEPVQ